MKLKSKKKLIAALFILPLFALGAYLYHITSTGFGTEKTAYIYIDTTKDYDNILNQLKTSAKIKDIGAFNKIASFLNYPHNIKTGRYAITPDMTVLEAVRLLKSGHQSPVKLKFNNIRTKEELAERISQQLMCSKDELLMALTDSVQCAQFGFTSETIVAMFIPNTYEFYWDIKVPALFKRMHGEYTKFWNEDRIAKAKSQRLTPLEVSILASIVEEECYYADEYPIVAGLYLNRLRSGQLLQADPTVKFAVGDFSIKRILNKHTELDSPYNTYKYAGLPPAPIRLPSIKGIDAVLNPTSHNYIYMCAKEDFSNRHNFAVTYAEHQRNAAKYRNALNQRGIYK